MNHKEGTKYSFCTESLFYKVSNNATTQVENIFTCAQVLLAFSKLC